MAASEGCRPDREVPISGSVSPKSSGMGWPWLRSEPLKSTAGRGQVAGSRVPSPLTLKTDP